MTIRFDCIQGGGTERVLGTVRGRHSVVGAGTAPVKDSGRHAPALLRRGRHAPALLLPRAPGRLCAALFPPARGQQSEGRKQCQQAGRLGDEAYFAEAGGHRAEHAFPVVGAQADLAAGERRIDQRHLR